MARSTASHNINGASPVDFSHHTYVELLEMRKQLQNEIQSRQAQEIESLRAKVMEAAGTLGVSAEEILGLRAERKTARYARGKQPAKYRGPNGEEWSGKGPAPKWMKPFLAKGKTKADFLIK
jgi:DNA-binding protein H-NS